MKNYKAKDNRFSPCNKGSDKEITKCFQQIYYNPNKDYNEKVPLVSQKMEDFHETFLFSKEDVVDMIK